MERFGVPRTSSASCCRPATASISTARRCISRWRACSWRSWPGVHMTFGQQLVMMLTLMLTSKGVAGVPRAALVVLTATLTQFGLPLEGAAILLGIDQVMDMGRTAVNVMGNCIATAVVARWEGVFDDEQMRAFCGATGGLMRVAVVGAAGQLGPRSSTSARGGDTRSSPSTRAELDVTRRRAVRRGGRGARPDVIVNGAAYTDVDGAEDHPVDALEVNAFARARAGRGGRGARAPRSCTTAPTSCSTASRRPYTEETRRIREASTPRSKLLGEWFARDAPRAYVLRVESLFGARRVRGPAEGQRGRIVDASCAGERSGCSRIGRFRRPTSSTSPRPTRGGRAAPRPACITASTPGLHLGGAGAGVGRQLGVEPRLGAAMAGCGCGRRARGTARCRTRSSRRPASTCRRGRTRSRTHLRRRALSVPGAARP